MKNNELRIGNYVQYENPHSDRVVVQVKAVDFQIGTHNLHPIPLTEEWMVKLGAIKKINIWTKYIFNDSNSISEYYKGEYIYLNSRGVVKEVKYVHELQNLYWCLCGEELIIK